MGLCSSCFKGSSSDYVTPDMVNIGSRSEFVTPPLEVRRKQQVEAAERRQQEQANRGIKDPEKVKRMQQRAEDLEKLERQTAISSQETGLKWQMN